MQLVPYSEFGRLRLRPFCPDDELYDEDVDEHGDFIKEEIRGVWFARWRKRPDELFVITVHLDDCSTDVAPLLFPKIRLKLEAGITPDEAELRFECAPESQTDGREIMDFRTSGQWPYIVHCSFGDESRLRSVSVRRLDIEIPDDE